MPGKKKTKKGDYYEVSEGKIKRKRTPCPKCGPGVFMAEHKDRLHCGRCGYTIMKSEKKAASSNRSG